METTASGRHVQALLAGQAHALELAVNGASLASVLSALARTFESQCDDDTAASILLLDPDGVHLRHAAGPSLPQSYTDAIDGLEIGPSAGSCGRAAFTAEPVIVTDIARDPLWLPYRELAMRHGLRACWSTPIRSSTGKILGTFAIYARYPRGPAPEDRAAIDLLSHTAALVIERVRSQDELRITEGRYRLVAEAANDAIWDWDLVTNQIVWNPGVLREYGYAPSAVDADASWRTNLIHPQDRAAVLAGIGAVIESGDLWQDEYRFQRLDGSYAIVLDRGRVVRDATGRPLRMVGSMLDLSERRRAQAQDRFLVRLDDAVRPLIEPGEITAAAAKLLGQHLGVNRCAYAQVEADRDTFFLTGNYTDGVHSIVGRYGLTQFGQECLRVMCAGSAFVAEDCRTDPRIEPESRKAYEAAAIRALIQIPILKAGQFVAAIAVHSSMPRRWQADEIELLRRAAGRCWESIERARLTRHREELLEAERAARAEAERLGHMKDEFLATLSHELRTPLNAILGWSHLLTSRATSDPGSIQQGAAVIARNARAQARMIEDLLDMSRIISGKVRLDVRPVPLHDIARAAMETVQTSADAKSVRLRLVGDTDPGVVSVDPSRLQQVIWNLLSNAVKFTPPGGSVELSIVRHASGVDVHVRDTGQGVPPEFLPFVFERFRQADASTTRRVGGLGLGLSIVKQLVELHGGRVRAESAGEGRGSLFTVTLPITASEVKRASAPPIPADPIGAPAAFDAGAFRCDGIAVLVVDDDADARDLVAKVLVECGAKVVTAVSSQSAVEALSRETFGLFVFDIGMPDEDGYDLIQRVRADERSATVPAIALTAFARPDDRRRALDAGYDMHVAKPVEPTDLLRACLSAVAGRPAPADRARAE